MSSDRNSCFSTIPDFSFNYAEESSGCRHEVQEDWLELVVSAVASLRDQHYQTVHLTTRAGHTRVSLASKENVVSGEKITKSKVAAPSPEVKSKLAEIKTQRKTSRTETPHLPPVKRRKKVAGGLTPSMGQNPSLVERPKLNKYATVNGADDLLIRKNKMDQIKEKFKLQEKALKEGKTSLMNLSKEELLFGFHL